jgi:hypothetical protein
MRAAGETETTQENIQDWLQLDEKDLGFLLLTEEFINLLSSALPRLLNFPFFFVFCGYLFFIIPDYRLIRMNYPQN